VAHGLTLLGEVLRPNGWLLPAAVVLDLLVGDPEYRWHPVRLVGSALSWFEARLRAIGLDGYVGGILLFVALAIVALAALVGALAVAASIASAAAWLLHGLILYSLLALGDLLRHVRRIDAAVRDGDLTRARAIVGTLVGRDIDRMDEGACRRAAVESLSENLTDGFVSAVFWYVLAGLPGLVLFKVVSTMDSMVGYKTPHYLRFGWCGARLDDVMNYLPARLTWIAIALLAALLPSYSGRKAWHVGLAQHGMLLGPNSGWSEAAAAGALQRRLVGPIWLRGALVTDCWIGAPEDPPLETAGDVARAMALALLCGVAITLVASAALVALG
jgi:adenosylcobinamide-phosphate synthase